MEEPNRRPYSNRSRGHRSPLDKLPEATRQELARRCYGEDTLATIQAWLLAEHSTKTSLTSISDWWKRRIAAGYAVESNNVRTVSTAGFEITILAPGAQSLTVRVQPTR